MSDLADITNLSKQVNQFLLSGAQQLALDVIDRAIPTYQHNSMFWVLRAKVLDRTGQREKAAESYEKSLSIDSSNLQALILLGGLWHGTDRQDRSRALFDKALSINPNSQEALILSIVGSLLMADLSNREALVDRLRHFVSINPDLFYLIKAAYWAPFLEIDDPEERQIWSAIANKIGQTTSTAVRSRTVKPQNQSKIRIGYASPNFGDHPIGHVTKSLYGTHDRSRFEVYLYSANPRIGDDSVYKSTIRRSCDNYVDISRMDVRSVQSRIEADRIDILVDLNGYMGTTKIIETFAGRPSPIQLYWLGHGGALGLPFYDYVIGDNTVTPPQDDHRYTESIARLPDTFHCTDRHEIGDELFKRSDFGLDDKLFVFCAFCNPIKLDPKVFAVWMQILKAVPESQLWISKGKNPSIQTNLQSCAEINGVDKERLVFADRLPDKRRHLARHRLADLFLDTFTVSASTMAIDSLWAGLPILSRPGRHFCSRNCASFLRAVGLEEMVCKTTQEYIDRAVFLATNPRAMRLMREKLMANRQSYPLFDIKRFTRHLEDAYQTMWERALSGKPAASFPS